MTVTYLETNGASGETSLNRLYLTGSQLRLDSIREYRPDLPLTDPQVGIQIVTSEPKTRDGVVRLKGKFSDPDAVFAAMLAKPSPPSRTTVSDGNSGFSSVLKLFGYTGKAWFPDQIRASDSVVATGDGTLKWTVAGKVSLEAELSADKSHFVKVAHEPLPGLPGGFEGAILQHDPAKAGDPNAYISTVKSRDAGTLSTTFQILDEKHGSIDPAVFQFGISDSSLVRTGGKVLIMQNGKLQTDEEAKKEKAEQPKVFALMAGGVAVICLVTVGFVAIRKNKSG